MTDIVVPNRRFVVHPDGACISVFSAIDLWKWPRFFEIIEPRLLWDRIYDGRVFDELLSLPLQREIFLKKAEYHDLDMFDLKPLFDSKESLWVCWSTSINLHRDRIILLMDTIQQHYDNHADVDEPIGIAWQLAQPLFPFFPGLDITFWDIIKMMWHNNPQLEGLLQRVDFGPTVNLEKVLLNFAKG